jgi:hypothetical protein
VFTGYFLSRRGAEKLMESAFPMDMHVDMYSCLNGEMGRIVSVYNTNIELKQFQWLALGTEDSDIRLDNQQDCHICDVPTEFHQRGILVISIPIVFIGLLAVSGLWYLGGKRRR